MSDHDYDTNIIKMMHFHSLSSGNNQGVFVKKEKTSHFLLASHPIARIITISTMKSLPEYLTNECYP